MSCEHGLSKLSGLTGPSVSNECHRFVFLVSQEVLGRIANRHTFADTGALLYTLKMFTTRKHAAQTAACLPCVIWGRHLHPLLPHRHWGEIPHLLSPGKYTD